MTHEARIGVGVWLGPPAAGWLLHHRAGRGSLRSPFVWEPWMELLRNVWRMPPVRGVAESVMLLVARCVAGVMFSVSGWNKLFTAGGRERMVATLHDAGIPWPTISAPVLGSIEWVAGALLVLGLLSRPAALLLAAICVVAALTDGIMRIPAGLGVLDWLSWFFYLSEVPLAVLLGWVVLAGSGRFAIESRWPSRALWRGPTAG